MTHAAIATAILARDWTLSERREELAMTQVELAEALGCSHDTIARAESKPGTAGAQRLAECLCALENGAPVKWREDIDDKARKEIDKAVREIGVPVIADRLGFTSTQAVYRLLKPPMTTKTASRLRDALDSGSLMKWKENQIVTDADFRKINRAVRKIGAALVAERLDMASTQGVYKLLKSPMTTKTAARLRAALEMK